MSTSSSSSSSSSLPPPDSFPRPTPNHVMPFYANATVDDGPQSDSTRTSDSGRQSESPARSSGTKEKKKRVRTKTGCVTCRIRRVKCDETRPSCVRCTSTGRKCDGWPAVPMSRRDLPVAIADRKSVLLSCHQVSGTGGFAQGIESLYFDFFRKKTTTTTNQLFDCEFWSKGVLQLSHNEPAIKHAVLAISALHQGWDLYGSSSVDVDRNAVLQYSKAVENAKELLVRSRVSRNPDKELVQKVLVACILFICFENLMGDYGAASMHLGNGLQILHDHAMAGRPLGMGDGPNPAFEAEIVELVQRYHFQAMTFAQTRWPFRQASLRFAQGPPPPLPLQFDTLGEVRRSLFDLGTWAMCVGEVLMLSLYGIPQHPVKDCATMLAEARLARSKVEEDLKLWKESYEDYVARETVRSGADFTKTVYHTWLSVYYELNYLIMIAGTSGVDGTFDEYIGTFQVMLDQCEYIIKASLEKAPLSLEVGVCIPLFFISNKCRHPTMRRRAIALLDADSRKEGIWETLPAARVCEKMMTMEENKATEYHARRARGGPVRQLLTNEDIPEVARIKNVFTEVNLPQRYVKIRCMFLPDGEHGEHVTVEERVDF